MYCITLRNKFDKTIIGWYDASASNFSTEPSTAPPKMWTPRQVFNAIKSANPRQSIESVQTRLKNNVGKPGMWIDR